MLLIILLIRSLLAVVERFVLLQIDVIICYLVDRLKRPSCRQRLLTIIPYDLYSTLWFSGSMHAFALNYIITGFVFSAPSCNPLWLHVIYNQSFLIVVWLLHIFRLLVYFVIQMFNRCWFFSSDICWL